MDLSQVQGNLIMVNAMSRCGRIHKMVSGSFQVPVAEMGSYIVEI